jgi:hypothetical protein
MKIQNWNIPIRKKKTTQRTIIQSPSGMRSPLANYLSTDSANDTQQYTATNGKSITSA